MILSPQISPSLGLLPRFIILQVLTLSYGTWVLTLPRPIRGTHSILCSHLKSSF